MGQPVVHFEIIGKDGEALKSYYSQLFGWEIDSNNPMNYGIVTARGQHERRWRRDRRGHHGRPGGIRRPRDRLRRGAGRRGRAGLGREARRDAHDGPRQGHGRRSSSASSTTPRATPSACSQERRASPGLLHERPRPAGRGAGPARGGPPGARPRAEPARRRRDPQWLADDPVRDGGLPGRRDRRAGPARGGPHLGPVARRSTGARRVGRRPLARRPAPPGRAAAGLRGHPPARCTGWPSTRSRRRAGGPTARSACASRWAASARPSSANDEQVRIEGDRIVRQFGPEARGESLTTLAGAAALALGGPPDARRGRGLRRPAGRGPRRRPSTSTRPPRACSATGTASRWSVLEEMRAEPAVRRRPGARSSGRSTSTPRSICGPDGPARATYGASPGDAAVDEPYLYVLPSQPSAARGGLWNATSFTGADPAPGRVPRRRRPARGRPRVPARAPGRAGGLTRAAAAPGSPCRPRRSARCLRRPADRRRQAGVAAEHGRERRWGDDR